MAVILELLLPAVVGAGGALGVAWLSGKGLPRMVAFLEIEGTAMVCRVHQEGFRPCKDVRVSFSKTNPEEWERWDAHVLYVEENVESHPAIFTSQTKRTYHITTAFIAANTERGFLPPITCHISWRRLWLKKEASFILSAASLVGTSYHQKTGLDPFVEGNKPALNYLIRDIKTLVKLKIQQANKNYEGGTDK